MIQFVSAHSANASSVAITTPQAGDLILVLAYRNSSTTVPSLGSGYTSLATQSPGGSANAGRIGYRISDGTETSTGTWTNATNIVALIHRGVDVIGALSGNAGNGSSIGYSSLSLQDTDGDSWVVGVAGAKAATAGMGGTTTDLTSNRASQTIVNGLDTAGGVSSFGDQTLAVTGSGRWITWSIELRAPDVTTIPFNADPGSLALSGVAAGLRVSRRLDADPGALSLGGADAGLTKVKVLAAEPGSLQLAGVDALLAKAISIYDRVSIIAVEDGAIGTPGAAVQLQYSSTVAGPWVDTFDPAVHQYMRQRVGEGAWSDAIQVTLSTAVPPNINVGLVTFFEEIYTEIDQSIGSRGRITLTHPTTNILLDAVEIWITPPGGSSRYWFEIPYGSTTAITPRLFELGSYTLTFYTRSRATIRSTGVTKVVVVDGVVDAPSAPTGLALVAGGAIWDANPAYEHVKSYRVFAWSGVDPSYAYDLLVEVDYAPTAANPVNVLPSRSSDADYSSASSAWRWAVQAVGYNGLPSAISRYSLASGGTSPFSSAFQTEWEGTTRHNVHLSARADFPTRFTVGGNSSYWVGVASFEIGSDFIPHGMKRYLVAGVSEGPGTLILKHQAGSGIKTPTGADVVVKPGHMFWVWTPDPSGSPPTSYVFLQDPGGGGVNKTISIVGANTQGTRTHTSTNPARGGAFQQTTTTSASNVTAVNITGKGFLKFLSLGQSITGSGINVRVTVTIDGSIVSGLNDAAVTPATGDPLSTALLSALVGTILTSKEGSTWIDCALFDDDGLEFKESLLIQFRREVTGTGYLGYHYELVE